MVFVSYAHADCGRVEPLVKALAARFNVWWDRDIEVGELWRRALQNKIDSARCVVVVWTVASVDRDFIWSEVERAKDRGVLLPVKLDRNAKIPVGFDQMQHLDLTAWTGRDSKGLEVLFGCIKRLLARPVNKRPYAPALGSATSVLDGPIQATKQLQQLTDEIETIGGILIPGTGPVGDLLGTLQEVHRTYVSISEAISRFMVPAVQHRPIDVKLYLAMERGTLVNLIEDNRGHCTRIVEYYVRVGGLRDWLQPRLAPEKLKVLDEVFGQLGTADGDLFAALADIGDVLTQEATVIAGLLLCGQQESARERILEGRNKLLPLEHCLSDAMRKLQRIESSLGFVPARGSVKRRT